MTELPTTFGKYYLSEKLATGGMAEIYLGKLIGPGGFEKQLVIKQIHPALTGQRQFVDLFVAEAKTLVTLTHGNIVPVYELGVVDDTYFIAMEYVDGPTLYRLTEIMAGRGERMDPPIAAWIAARIAEGLDYAHRKGEGVVHRDLSPRNVMLSRDGEVKLVDFGIAIAHGDAADSHNSAPAGSFPYMSPEQARREALTGQTDLFSLGVLLWEMLVGKRLFSRNDADATLDAVLHDDIPAPSTLRADVSAKLDEVVMRALARDRDARWPDAGELLAALNRYLYSLDATPGPREVAAIVGQFCPPEHRRLPTHADPWDPEPAEAPADVPAGPRTAVIPREASAPQGRRAHRAKTFATHVELEHILVRAGTASEEESESDTSDEDEPAAEAGGPVTVVEPTAERPPVKRETAADRALRIAPPFTASGGPPSRLLLILLGLGALVGAGIVVWTVMQGRDRILRSDASAIVTSPPPVADTAMSPPLDGPAAVAVDVIDAGVAVTSPIDAPRAVVHAPHDAGAATIAHAPIDASAAITPVTTTATGVLVIGADPYAEILIDGKSYGSTPQRVTVTAGHHVVVLRYAPDGSPPREQKLPVEVAADSEKPLQATFP
jgi:eukaryotic-like serine/threonine-protein kinase